MRNNRVHIINFLEKMDKYILILLEFLYWIDSAMFARMLISWKDDSSPVLFSAAYNPSVWTRTGHSCNKNFIFENITNKFMNLSDIIVLCISFQNMQEHAKFPPNRDTFSIFNFHCYPIFWEPLSNFFLQYMRSCSDI